MNNYENFLLQYTSSDKKKGNSFSPDSLLHFFNENVRAADSRDERIKAEQQKQEPISTSKFSINSQIASGMSETKDTPRSPVISGVTRGAAAELPAGGSSSPSYSATVVRSRRDEVYLTDIFGRQKQVQRPCCGSAYCFGRSCCYNREKRSLLHQRHFH